MSPSVGRYEYCIQAWWPTFRCGSHVILCRALRPVNAMRATGQIAGDIGGEPAARVQIED